MVTAMPANVNATLIMSMHKIARVMDVSTYIKPLSFFLLLYEYINTYEIADLSWSGVENLEIWKKSTALLEVPWGLVSLGQKSPGKLTFNKEN